MSKPTYEQLEARIAELEGAVYCPTCGSCGEDGCCHPGKCKAVECLYGVDNVRMMREREADLENLDRYFEALHRIVQGDWNYQQVVSIAREAITPKA